MTKRTNHCSGTFEARDILITTVWMAIVTGRENCGV